MLLNVHSTLNPPLNCREQIASLPPLGWTSKQQLCHSDIFYACSWCVCSVKTPVSKPGWPIHLPGDLFYLVEAVIRCARQQAGCIMGSGARQSHSRQLSRLLRSISELTVLQLCLCPSVQIENIDACLTFLAAKGVNTQGLSAEGKPGGGGPDQPQHQELHSEVGTCPLTVITSCPPP